MFPWAGGQEFRIKPGIGDYAAILFKHSNDPHGRGRLIPQQEARMPPDDNNNGQLEIGDPAPWFDAQTLAGASISLGVVAGRWVALGFFNALVARRIRAARWPNCSARRKLFDDDHLVFYGILTEPPAEARASSRK
jgi:hypothetical protein